MTDYEAEARARLNTKEGRLEAITQRAYSRRFGNGNSNYIRECADDEYELIGFLADAEQERDALAARLATLAAAGITTGEDGEPRLCGLTGAEIDRLGAVVNDVRPTVRDINAFVAGWEATRDDTHAIITVSRRLLQSFLGSAAALSLALAAAGRGADGEAGE